MLTFVLDEIVAAADIVAVEAMSITNLLYEEGETTADFIVEAVSWTENLFLRAAAIVGEF